MPRLLGEGVSVRLRWNIDGTAERLTDETDGLVALVRHVAECLPAATPCMVCARCVQWRVHGVSMQPSACQSGDFLAIPATTGYTLRRSSRLLTTSFQLA